MDKIKKKVNEFMQGRRGVDDLGLFIIIVSFIIIFLSIIFKNQWFYLAAVAFSIILYFRILSKNIGKCELQNKNYLEYKKTVKNIVGKTFSSLQKQFKGKTRTKKTSKGKDTQKKQKTKIFPCPSCGQKLSVPKKIGVIEIKCTRCNHKFIRKT